jgi:hypothetical protein
MYASEKAPVSEFDSNRSGSGAISILAEMFHGYSYGYPLLKFLQS